ncbi:YqzE family protein [Paenibacillus koleovorans]|uniref:YqzE family protein n=1 Tax=Paenibacillus koleovorans TaxID=121608 RepID=UPI000FDB357E|nr:YqzE family protein [Paenibacillus koleovorans]
MANKSEDLIKYITEQVVTYIDTPAEVRKETRKAQKDTREPWVSRWFGQVPYAISLWLTDWRSRRQAKKRTPSHEKR